MFGQKIPCCRYNKGVECTDKTQCRKCGWSPHTKATRLMKIKKTKSYLLENRSKENS